VLLSSWTRSTTHFSALLLASSRLYGYASNPPSTIDLTICRIPGLLQSAKAVSIHNSVCCRQPLLIMESESESQKVRSSRFFCFFVRRSCTFPLVFWRRCIFWSLGLQIFSMETTVELLQRIRQSFRLFWTAWNLANAEHRLDMGCGIWAALYRMVMVGGMEDGGKNHTYSLVKRRFSLFCPVT
jgi:hypothetical protein